MNYHSLTKHEHRVLKSIKLHTYLDIDTLEPWQKAAAESLCEKGLLIKRTGSWSGETYYRERWYND